MLYKDKEIYGLLVTEHVKADGQVHCIWNVLLDSTNNVRT